MARRRRLRPAVMARPAAVVALRRVLQWPCEVAQRLVSGTVMCQVTITASQSADNHGITTAVCHQDYFLSSALFLLSQLLFGKELARYN
jgi:hypothetical protein